MPAWKLLEKLELISPGLLMSAPMDLQLVKRGENTGTVAVQAIVLLTLCNDGSTISLSKPDYTDVDPSMFSTPVKRSVGPASQAVSQSVSDSVSQSVSKPV